MSEHYAYYDGAIGDAIANWDGSSDLSSDIDQAMQSIGYQYQLTDDDLAYIAGQVSVASASSGDWFGADYQGEHGDDIVEMAPSIFAPPMRSLWRWLAAIVATVIGDVGGFVGGFIASWSAPCMGDANCMVGEGIVLGGLTSISVAAIAIDSDPFFCSWGEGCPPLHR